MNMLGVQVKEKLLSTNATLRLEIKTSYQLIILGFSLLPLNQPFVGVKLVIYKGQLLAPC